MTLDCYLPYSITGNAVSLNGGLKYSCLSGGRRFFELPLSLSASQSWLVEGSESNPAELWYGASVVGGANSLELNLVESGDFVLYGADIEAKHITVNGFGKGVLGLVPKQFAFGGGEEARLNAGGGPVTLNEANIRGDGTVGELESYDTTTEPGHQISVAGNAYFDSASTITLSVEPLVPSRLAVSGILTLASPHLSLSTTFGEECPVLGQEFILITASGGLGGSFNGITNGGTTQAECRGVQSTFQIRYRANEVIATDIGEPPPPPPPGPPVNTSSPAISGTPDVGETLSCSLGTWAGKTPQTYIYTWIRGGTVVVGPGSQSTYIPIAADQSYQLQCEVTATNASGSSTALSAAVNVAPVPCPLSNPFCGQQDYQMPDIKIVQYIKRFGEVPGTDCLSSFNSLGVRHIDSIILCTGLEQSANPDPPSYLGGSVYQSFANSKEYRGLVHINPFTVQCTNGLVTATSPQSGEYSIGYTPVRVPVIGTIKYDAAEPFSAPPFGYLYNANPFPFAIDGGNLDVLVLDAGRVARVPRELLFEDSGYDAPFIWTELKGSIGCGSYALRLRVSDFPSVAVYVNNHLVEGLTQSHDLATFTAQGCRAFGETGVGRFDFNRNPSNVVLTASGASLQPELSDPSAYSNPAWLAQTCTSSGATTLALRLATPTLQGGGVSVTFAPPAGGNLIAQVTGQVSMAKVARHLSGVRTQTTVLVATHRRARAKRPLKLVLHLSRAEQLALRKGRIGGLKLVLTLVESHHGVLRAERNIRYHRCAKHSFKE
ncbi:MAG TPA: hypothetical protein VGL57_01140 [Solirubrobacteraceae bacterium]|jgi:hypothetical protein